MNRSDFQNLAELRLREAKALLAMGFPDGAYYLAGYAVECGLKACNAKRTKEYDLPPDRKQVDSIYSHDLSALVDVAELSAELKDLIDRDPSMRLDWDTIKDWSEKSRYEENTAEEAKVLLEAVEHEKGGLLPWVRLHW
jgi:HEPN domain-containing protein